MAIMEDEKIQEIIERIKSDIEKVCYRSPINNLLRQQIKDVIECHFQELQFNDDVLMLADGMAIKNLIPNIDPQNHSLNISVKTDFFPAPRYGYHEGDTIILGFFDKYDLYVAMQSPLPSTLIAKYGANPEDYLSCNPYMIDIEKQSKMFVEAMRRASIINVQW